MSTQNKQVWVLAGGNGAGKTTFFKKFLKPLNVSFINADEIEKEIGTDSYEAAHHARARFQQQLELGMSFCYETVFSHDSKVKMVQAARDAGYDVTLICIHIDQRLNVLRVEQRVREGGHNVDADKVVSRVPRTLKHLREAVKIANVSLLYDNSSAKNPYCLLAEKRGEIISYHMDTCPEWVHDMLNPDDASE